MTKTRNQFSLTRAPSITSGRAKKQNLISSLLFPGKFHWLEPLVVLCCMVDAVSADQFGDFTYTDTGTTITITAYTGSCGAVDIPASIVIGSDSKPVTSIGDGAFQGLTSLTGVTIPDSVTSIGVGAFAACGNLAGVTIGNSVTSIGNGAFQACKLASVTIPNSVISIGIRAFFSCSSLTSVVVGNSVSGIGNQAFSKCASLTGVTLGSSVTSIGLQAFNQCSSLASVTLPSSVTNIGDQAFYSCSVLTGVYFKGNAPTLGSGVFDLIPANQLKVYYLPETTGWPTPPPTPPLFGGRPIVLWNPQVQTSDARFGVGTNGFGFTITGSSNLVIVVEACTNLPSPIWSPVETNTLTGGSSYFSDSEWTNYPARFYRLRSP